jgi:hypothetical protein
VPSPRGLDLIKDAAETPVNFRVDSVELLREPSTAEGRYVDRLPVVAWLGIEPVPKASEQALADVRRHAGRFALLWGRIDAKEVPNPRHAESESSHPRLDAPTCSGVIPATPKRDGYQLPPSVPDSP